jgi:hypothetical protein
MKVMLLAALLGSTLGAAPGVDEAVAVKVGAPAPDFEGTWLNHPDSSLLDLGGRIVFIESWRTW